MINIYKLKDGIYLLVRSTRSHDILKAVEFTDKYESIGELEEEVMRNLSYSDYYTEVLTK